MKFFVRLILFLGLLTLPAGFHAEAAEINVAFSPHGKSLELILDVIASAEKSIHVAAFSFTSRPVAQALLAAHRRGVDVRVVCDEKANTKGYTATTFLANRGVPVRMNGNYAIMHNKYIVVDGRHVQTGSFNYSAAAAERNAENVLVLRDAPELAAQFVQDWERLWHAGKPLEARH